MTDLPLRRHSRWQRVRLVVVRPAGTPAPHSINEVVELLFHALQLLGCSVDFGGERADPRRHEYFLSGASASGCPVI